MLFFLVEFTFYSLLIYKFTLNPALDQLYVVNGTALSD